MSETIVHMELDGQPCPACGGALDICSGLDAPPPGAYLLCAYCYVWLVLETPIRVMTNREWLALSLEHKAYLTGMRDRFRAAFPDGPPTEARHAV